MSNKKHSNNNKVKKSKIEFSSSKKPEHNKPTNLNPHDLYCNNCGLFLDDIVNFRYVFTDDLGDIDVCAKCLEALCKSDDNPFKEPKTPSAPTIPTNKGIVPSVPNPLFTNVPKIRLVFFNKSNPDDSTKTETTETTETTKSKNKDKKKKDDKEKSNSNSSACNSSACNSSGCNNEDDNGILFFQQILNRLNGIDNPSSCSNDEDVDTEIEDEEEDYCSQLEFEWLGGNIKTIDDLIALGKSYDARKRKRYNLNLKQLNKLVAPLEELQSMVGMSDVKKIIFDQLIYYLQNLDDKNVDMLHTVIVGPPGVGKTQLTHIIAKIYNRLGFLKTDKVICAKRDDLIGEYIGQTAPKTRKVLENALGGVLLLDEIYSLAPTSDRDFAREAIDMINMYLSEHAHDLVCVVAGYKKPTYEKFFSQNEGLSRRFTHHFEIKGYTHDELAQIFKKYLESQKWILGASLEEVSEIIKGYMNIFPNFGGDMTTLFACCKKAHSRRLLAISTEAELNATKKKIQKSDILEAIVIYKEIKEKHSSADKEDKSKYMHMYT
jgi:hypothetical protein